MQLTGNRVDAVLESSIAVRVTFMGEIQTLVGQRELRLSMPQGATVADLFASLSKSHGDEFTSCVFAAQGKLQQSVLVFVDGENIKERGGLAATLGNGEVEVLMLQVIEGG